MAAQPKLKEYQAKRDFQKTREPSGEQKAKSSARLRFVVQRHEASHLHFDLRLELNGVMKSWAVPKGPSFDPAIKRLAVQVEDHPISYNDFEGSIPEGEYGGGTVMLWDRGYYTLDKLGPKEDPEQLLQEQIEQGKISFSFHGKRLKGSFALIRMSSRGAHAKPQWLLTKHHDRYADPDYDPVATEKTSVKSAKTMDQLRSIETKEPRVVRAARSDVRVAKFDVPMLVSIAEELPVGADWTYEPKIDGIRILAYVDPKSSALVTRLGNDKSSQFPELGPALQALSKRLKKALILDGEICAVDAKGRALGFQSMQGRIHLDGEDEVKSEQKKTRIAFFIFDVLLLGEKNLMGDSWTKRRHALEKILARPGSRLLKLVETDPNAKDMQKKSKQLGWEGLIAKDVNSTYAFGKRGRAWVKWRTQKRDEFLVLGWTEPRGSRKHIGSLLLGYYDEGRKLHYAGHAGSGLSGKVLSDLHEKLKAIESDKSAFAEEVSANNTVHWVLPRYVAEVRFKEWTQEKRLRQASFLGLRDDKRPDDIMRANGSDSTKPLETKKHGQETAPRGSAKKAKSGVKRSTKKAITAIPDDKESLDLELADGKLHLTHLNKVYFPKDGITKRDLIDYYASMAEYILPWMEDRPLVLRRFPNGIEENAFYQQSPDDNAPGRLGTVSTEDGTAKRLIGGELITLLYLPQIGAISYDPWHSRVQSLHNPDYSIIDLDPGEGASFKTVRKVAAACAAFLESRKIPYALKSSGATGIHIYLPLPKGTTWETSRLLAELVCTHMAESMPGLATVERSIKKRRKGSIYMDSQQNDIGKSVAGVWSVRARPGASVSTPLALEELEQDFRPEDFDRAFAMKEAKARSKLWNKALAKPIVIEKLLKEP